MSHYQHPTKKRFGQHFLTDNSVIERMLQILRLQADDPVIEIGPGSGALTYPLLAKLNQLDVVEIDRDIIAWWQAQTKLQEKLTIHAQDALKLSLPSLQRDQRPLRIVGNLPYNISTPLIFHLLRNRAYIRDMLFMLQKEVVDRITAEPDGEHYGRLSVMVQYYCQPHYVLTVPPSAFSPPPKVDSAVVYLQPWLNPPHLAQDEAHFYDLVGQAFGQRRKTLRNTLRGLLTSEQIELAGINPQQRAETLSVEDFVRLSNLL
jgi:16S rRNA (adenine1518-N6/adenine1519-N6)-dimethyltransferase